MAPALGILVLRLRYACRVEIQEPQPGDIGQDESRTLSDRVQKMTDEMISEVDRLLGDKEKEIMQV